MASIFKGFVAVFPFMVALLAGAAENPPSQPATQPAASEEAPKQRIKPSDPPQLTLFFTDQVVGYINPCG